MPRKYKRSNTRKRSGKKSRSKSRGGACNAVPNLPYANPCASGAQLDGEFAKAMTGGAEKGTLRMRKGNRRSYRRRNTKRKSNRKSRKSRKSMRGSGYTFVPPAAGSPGLGGHHSSVAYNDCCAPNFSPGVAEPSSFGVGSECNVDGTVAGQAGQAGGSSDFGCKQPNWGPSCH